MRQNNKKKHTKQNKRPKGPLNVHLGTLKSCFLSSFVEFRTVVSEQKSKMSKPFRGQAAFLIVPKNINLVEDVKILLPVKFHWIPIKKSSMSQPFRGYGGHLVFLIGPKNTKLVEDVEILLPVKFRIGPQKHKIGRGRWDLASCQVSLNSVQRFQRSRKYLSQRPGRPSCFSNRPMLSSCFMSSFVEFCSAVSEKKLEMWKVTDGRTTDNAWSQ